LWLSTQRLTASSQAVEQSPRADLQRPEDCRDLEVAADLVLAVDLGPIGAGKTAEERIEGLLLGQREAADAQEDPDRHLMEGAGCRRPLVAAVVQGLQTVEEGTAILAPVAAEAGGVVLGGPVASELALDRLEDAGAVDGL
jgi:hypothetical protein